MNVFRRTATIALGLILLLGVSLSSAAAPSNRTVIIGWTPWSDAEFVTQLTKTLIEKRFDYSVELQIAAIGAQYQGVADGDLDLMLMAWLPDTHAVYYDPIKDQVEDLGALYTGAELGWVVPDYVPHNVLGSIADLAKPEVIKRLGGRIQGIDPGAGLMQLSENAMSAYGLDSTYKLIPASGSDMTAALARAEQNKEWIVVTGWTPQWMFGRWPLHFLSDPKHALGRAQHVDVLARNGFSHDYPELAAMLSAMHIPLHDLQIALYSARQNGEKAAVARFIENHPRLIDSWFASKH